MSFITKHTVTVTTDSSGDGTAYTTAAVNGRLLGVQYVKTDYANGVDFDVTLEGSALAVLSVDDVNASAVYWPRVALHNTSGVALTYDATEPVTDTLPVANERIKVVVAAGGDTKTGTFYIYVEGN